MKETLLLKIALICSLAGLVGLYFISAKIEIKDYKPSEISKNAGDDVRLIGKVSKITSRGNITFIDVNQETLVNVVVFDENNIELKKEDTVEVIGKVQYYNGKEEIIAQKIRVIR